MSLIGGVWKFCMKIGGQIYKGGGHFKKGGLIKKFIKPVLISLSHNDFEFEMDLNALFPFFSLYTPDIFISI